MRKYLNSAVKIDFVFKEYFEQVYQHFEPSKPNNIGIPNQHKKYT